MTARAAARHPPGATYDRCRRGRACPQSVDCLDLDQPFLATRARQIERRVTSVVRQILHPGEQLVQRAGAALKCGPSEPRFIVGQGCGQRRGRVVSPTLIKNRNAGANGRRIRIIFHRTIVDGARPRDQPPFLSNSPKNARSPSPSARHLPKAPPGSRHSLRQDGGVCIDCKPLLAEPFTGYANKPWSRCSGSSSTRCGSGSSCYAASAKYPASGS